MHTHTHTPRRSFRAGLLLAAISCCLLVTAPWIESKANAQAPLEPSLTSCAEVSSCTYTISLTALLKSKGTIPGVTGEGNLNGNVQGGVTFAEEYANEQKPITYINTAGAEVYKRGTKLKVTVTTDLTMGFAGAAATGPGVIAAELCLGAGIGAAEKFSGSSIESYDVSGRTKCDVETKLKPIKARLAKEAAKIAFDKLVAKEQVVKILVQTTPAIVGIIVVNKVCKEVTYVVADTAVDLVNSIRAVCGYGVW